MKPFGSITRGTTNPNRLRRIDNWILWRYQTLLSSQNAPLVVDLGYGATPVTTLELSNRLRKIQPTIKVVGLEIDPARVAAAQRSTNEGVSFALGGFEIPTNQRPLLIRALNVLRQYQESEVRQAWAHMRSRLSPGGFIIEGTCDEIGRRASWIEVSESGPTSLTLATELRTLDKPSDLAPRLPKLLIHRNVQGEPIFELMRDMDAAWERNSPLSVFSARQRWAALVRQLRKSWPVLTPPSREKNGEITIAWSAVTSEGVERL